MTYESPYSKMEYHVGYFELGQANWETVFEGNVTTTAKSGRCVGDVGNALSGTAESIKVTFNETEYTCEKKELQGTTYYGGDPNDFSTYPFQLGIDPVAGTVLLTQSAGTYSLKIEEPQSGGSSDFSTAEVEITGVAEIYGAFLRGDGSYYINSARTVTIILYKGKATLMSSHAPKSVTGNISYDSDREEFTVTGDGTITFGGLGL